jgi:cold shock CspA family protein
VTTDGEEVFLHERQFVASGTKPPAKGQPARFHVHYPFKGPEALNVEVLHD